MKAGTREELMSTALITGNDYRARRSSTVIGRGALNGHRTALTETLMMVNAEGRQVRPVWWEDGAVHYVDQRFLPCSVVVARALDAAAVVAAIVDGAVCGSRCIDLFGAFGVALARTSIVSDDEYVQAIQAIRAVAERQGSSGAVERAAAAPRGGQLDAAMAVAAENLRLDRAIAEHGAYLLPMRGSVLTHGSSGAFATGGSGTAAAAIIAAVRAGKRLRVFIGESRPSLAGARLTAFDFAAAAVPATLVADGAVAWLAASGELAAVIVGVDTIAANGDSLATIGTYGVALAAAQHGVPFYVACARAAIDVGLACGQRSAIGEGPPEALRSFAQCAIAARDVAVYNPSADITPGRLIAGIVTEYGVTRPPYHESIPNLMTRLNFAFVHRG